MKATLFCASILCVFMTSCSYFTSSENLVRSSYNATDMLLRSVKTSDVSARHPILVTSLVDINNLSKSSTFGRMVSEQISSRLVQQGYKVKELKMRTDSVFVQETKGEFLLSRALQNISVQHNAHVVVVGTYAKASKEAVYVNVKLVRAQDGVILSAYDYRVNINAKMKSMIMSK